MKIKFIILILLSVSCTKDYGDATKLELTELETKKNNILYSVQNVLKVTNECVSLIDTDTILRISDKIEKWQTYFNNKKIRIIVNEVPDSISTDILNERINIQGDIFKGEFYYLDERLSYRLIFTDGSKIDISAFINKKI